MYLTYFGLQRRPFPSTPDTACYYPGTGQEQALARLRRALADGEAMILLSGEAGTGKTLLCHCLLGRLPAETVTAFLTNSHIGSRKDLLQAILYDLSLPYEAGSEQELRLRLTDYLLKNFAAGRKTLLIADEAHYLSVEALEELRLLCNLEADGGKAVQVVLAAQPAVQRTLARRELASFRQRLAVRIRVDALGVEEAIDYLLHHFRAAGGQPEAICTDEALEMLARGTRGIPRLLNQAAHQSLGLAFELQAETVDAEIVLEVLTSLGLHDSCDGEEAAPAMPLQGIAKEIQGEIEVGSGVERPPEISAANGLELKADLEGSDVPENPFDVLAYRLYDPPQPA